MMNEAEQTEKSVAKPDPTIIHQREYDWADDQVDYLHLQQLAREAHLID